MPTLYVWIRSDLESMNTGKACAQVAHAASQAAHLMHGGFATKKQNESYKKWENSAEDEGKTLGISSSFTYGFGTTIVLDGGSGNELEDVYNNLRNIPKTFVELCGKIVDPSYPVRDGSQTWTVPATTCVWAFVTETTSEEAVQYIKTFKLR